MRKGIVGLFLACATVITLAPATAQELTSGTIAGRVVDPAGQAIANAVVIATCQFGTRTATTGADGRFILPFLRPASYAVRVEAPGGFTTVIQEDVVVGLNLRAQLAFTLEPGVRETVTVRAESPLVDIRSTSSGTNVRYDEFAGSVPLGRAFTDTYAVAPGVVSGLGTGRGNYSIGGASGLENAYLVDGVNITNSGYGGIGSYNLVHGSLGTGVTSEFLDEVQIRTGGFEAEYGQALGGIINTNVKSGTNEFKGSVAWYSTPGSLQGAERAVDLSTGNTNNIEQSVNDFAFSLGGPIVKDKVFYFFAYNPVVTTRSLRASSVLNPAFDAASAGVAAFDEGGSANGFGVSDALAFPSSVRSLERRRRANNFAAKISWALSPRHQLEFTVFGDPVKGDMGPQRGAAALTTDQDSGGGESEIDYGSTNLALKWNGVFSPRFFMEAQIARHDGKFREDSARDTWQYADIRNLLEFIRGADSYDDPGSGLVPLSLSPVTNLRGGVGLITEQDDENTQYTVKFTNIFGNHEIKYGVQYDDIRYREAASYTGPSFNIGLPVSNTFGDPVDAVDNVTGAPGSDGVQDFIFVPSQGGGLVDVRNSVGADPLVAYDSANNFRVTRARIGPQPPATTAEDTNVFMQDTWTVTPRVSIRAGLRWTRETVAGAGSFTLPFGTQVIDYFGADLRIFTPGTSTYSPDGYTFSGNWAPRIGVAWDVLGNGRSRAWLNAARYYQRVPNHLAVRAFSNEVTLGLQDFDDRDLTTPRTLGFSYPFCDDGGGGFTSCSPSGPVFTQGIDPTSVVDGTKLPYEDELSGGYAFEVTPESSLEVRAIYRTQGRALEDVQVSSVEQIQNFYYGTGYGYPYDPFGGSPGTPVSTTFPAAPFGSYMLANPGSGDAAKGSLFDFPDPTRTYRALEVIYTRRFSNNWSLFANYRLSRLTGNYEGLYRNDNGQSDPNFSTLYDFPDTPLMRGQYETGVLPTDTTHVLHVYPSYRFGDKLRIGGNLTWASGVPRTSLLAHPIYQNAGEIPGIDPVYAYWADNGVSLEVRTTSDLSTALSDPDATNPGGVFLQSYTPVRRGNLGRAPDTFNVDLHFDYPLALGTSRLSVFLDVFNVFNSRQATAFVDTVELQSGVTDPDFGAPLGYRSPRSWRVGTRWSF
jgi:hypothetical protein